MIMLSIASRWFVDHEEDKHVWNDLLTSWENDEVFRELVTTLVILENNALADTVHHPLVEMKTLW